jgi:type I restriction enzyme S subunit
LNTKWPKVRLGEVLTPIWREEKVNPSAEYSLLGVRWYGGGLFIKEKCLGQQIRADRLYRVQEGDFVYNRLFGWKGSFAVAGPESDGCYVSNEFPCFVVDQNRLNANFLCWYFRREPAWNEVLKLSTGATPTSRNRLKEQIFLNLEIPLPPLPEQRRIVTKIDQLAAKIAEARSLRQQAIETAEALANAKRRVLFGEVMSRFVQMRLEELTTRITKGESPEWQGFTYQDTGPIFIRSENVLWGGIDYREAVHIPPAFHEKLVRSQLRSGDVLINLVGASIGRACVVPSSLGTANVNQAVAVISPMPQTLVSDFLAHFFLSPFAQDLIHGGKVETARPNISLGDLRELEIPVPPLPEQRRIVSELEALQAGYDALKRFQAHTAEEFDGLLPSILNKAFKGEL